MGSRENILVADKIMRHRRAGGRRDATQGVVLNRSNTR